MIKLWAPTMALLREFDLSTMEGCFVPSVRAIKWDAPASRLAVGTSGSEIFELSSHNGQNLHKAAISAGHFQVRRRPASRISPSPLRILLCRGLHG